MEGREPETCHHHMWGKPKDPSPRKKMEEEMSLSLQTKQKKISMQKNNVNEKTHTRAGQEQALEGKKSRQYKKNKGPKIGQSNGEPESEEKS